MQSNSKHEKGSSTICDVVKEATDETIEKFGGRVSTGADDSNS